MKLVNMNPRPMSILDDVNRIMNTVLHNNVYQITGYLSINRSK